MAHVDMGQSVRSPHNRLVGLTHSVVFLNQNFDGSLIYLFFCNPSKWQFHSNIPKSTVPIELELDDQGRSRMPKPAEFPKGI